MKKPMVTANRAAQEYGRSSAHISRMCKEGKVEGQLMWVPGFHTPVWVVNRKSLEAYLNRVPTADMNEVEA